MPRVPLLALLLVPGLALGQPCGSLRFLPARDVAPISAPVVRVADVSGDGRADLLTLDADGTVGVQIQEADGAFTPYAPLRIAAFDLVIADVDGEGSTDAILLGTDGPRLLRTSPDRSLSVGAPPASAPPHLTQGRSTAFADLDGNGRMVLLVTLDDSLWAWRLGPDGSFEPSLVGPAPAGATLVAGDFDGDGHVDLLLANPSSPLDTSALSRILRGDGRGLLTPGPSFPLPQVLSAASGDIDGDGRTDLVYRALVTTSGSSWSVAGLARGDASAGVAPRRGLALAGSAGDSVLMADLDGDGRSEVIDGFPGGLAVFRGDAAAALTRIGTVPVPRARPVAVADLDGDGRPDLLLVVAGRLQVASGVCGAGVDAR
jgi:hypothetical protein